jgi:acetylornithine deacetylase/succinyl-diaminopimelate desuccinylase-like protein
VPVAVLAHNLRAATSQQCAFFDAHFHRSSALQANLSVRYVPNQTADALVGHLQRHLQHEFRKLRSSNKLQFAVKSRGQAWSADPASAYFKQAAAAIEAEWGEAPLPVREGGTMPCASLLESLLGAPAIMIPMGQNSDNCHLANERLRRQNLIKGKNVMRRIVEGMGAHKQA